jgi:hypothetical protein
VSFQATPTPTRSVESSAPSVSPTAILYATVPDVVGRSFENARQLVQAANLALVVDNEQHHAEVPASHIISQAPSAGDQIPQGTEISVRVSLGPEPVTVPDVLGFPLTVKRLDLEDLGLVVVVTDTWSTEPSGLIVHQEPPPGAVIDAGSVITLSISTGSRSLVEANFDNKLVLYSAELNGTSFRPGDTLQLMVTWHVLDRLPAAYTTFIHLIDNNDKIVAQLDRPPLGGSRPTDTWRQGEKFLDPYSLPLPTHIRPGSYWVHIGLYRGNQRLSVIDPGSAMVERDALVVHEIAVKN